MYSVGLNGDVSVHFYVYLNTKRIIYSRSLGSWVFVFSKVCVIFLDWAMFVGMMFCVFLYFFEVWYKKMRKLPVISCV